MSNEPDKIIYSMIRVSKRHGQKEVLKDISLSYFYGAKIGVLGLNGAGKSSLLKILAGVDQAFDGKTVLAPGYTIGYLEQEPLAHETRTVREVVEEGVSDLTAIAKEFEEINARFAEPMEPEEMDALIAKQAEVQELMDAKGVWDLDSRLEMAMDALRCPPGDMPVDKISGGERRRVALCRLLLQNPDILLLDEPTNHLDAESVAWLESYLGTFPGTVIAVTHDRYFLDNIVDRIFAFEDGHLQQYEGGYTDYLEASKRRRAAAEGVQAVNVKAVSGSVDTGKADSTKTWKQNRQVKLKFTYKEQREFETIDDDIAALEEKVADIDAQILANATNAGRLNELTRQKEEAGAQLEEKLDRWVYLNDLAERIERGEVLVVKKHGPAEVLGAGAGRIHVSEVEGRSEVGARALELVEGLDRVGDDEELLCGGVGLGEGLDALGNRVDPELVLARGGLEDLAPEFVGGDLIADYEDRIGGFHRHPPGGRLAVNNTVVDSG